MNKQWTHGFEGAAAGQPVGVERFWTVLSRRDQVGQDFTGILIVTAAHLLHTGNLDPNTCNVLLQRDVDLRKRGEEDTLFKWKENRKWTGERMRKKGLVWEAKKGKNTSSDLSK